MKYSAYALLITLYYFFIMSKSKQIILKSLIIALFFGLSSCEANRQEKKKANWRSKHHGQHKFKHSQY
jgi:hypothetical protein